MLNLRGSNAAPDGCFTIALAKLYKSRDRMQDKDLFVSPCVVGFLIRSTYWSITHHMSLVGKTNPLLSPQKDYLSLCFGNPFSDSSQDDDD